MSAQPAEYVIVCDQLPCRERHFIPASSVQEALEIAVDTYEWQIENEHCYCPLHSDAA